MTIGPARGTIAVIAPNWNQAMWAENLAGPEGGNDVRVWPDLGQGPIAYAAVWMPPPGALAGLDGLEVIFNLGAGVDHLLNDRTTPDLPIVRSVVPDLAQRMGEYVALQALTHTRLARLYDAQQRRGEWRHHPHAPAGAFTVGIMGYGELGRHVSGVLEAIGFDVVAWSRTEKADASVTCYAGSGGLDAFLGRTDILVALLPSTAETRGILNRDLFARLRRSGPLGGAVLINAGRGALQVDADIVAALDDNTLAAASLDVFDPEPLDPASPLWSHKKAVITPHAAADSSHEVLAADVLQQIAAYEAGGRSALAHVVDRGRGY